MLEESQLLGLGLAEQTLHLFNLCHVGGTGTDNKWKIQAVSNKQNYQRSKKLPLMCSSSCFLSLTLRCCLGSRQRSWFPGCQSCPRWWCLTSGCCPGKRTSPGRRWAQRPTCCKNHSVFACLHLHARGCCLLTEENIKITNWKYHQDTCLLTDKITSKELQCINYMAKQD